MAGSTTADVELSAGTTDSDEFVAEEVDHEAALADVGPFSVFRGRGVWVWEASQADPEQLTALLEKRHFHYLALKAHHGTQSMNTPAIAAYRAAASRHGLFFGIWGYLTAGRNDKKGIPATAASAAAEAQRAADLVGQFGVDFYIADAEVEYRDATEAVSRAFAGTFRHLLPSLPAALSSYGRIDLHPGLDWATWYEFGFEYQPQAYECDSDKLPPKLCISHALADPNLWPATMIRPTIGAYKGARGRLTPAQLAASLADLPTQGFSVYRAGAASESTQPAGEADYAALSQVPVTPVTTIPNRPLAITSPYLEGGDVRAIQKATNSFRQTYSLPLLDEDGEYGPVSHEAAVSYTYYLGIADDRCLDEPVTVDEQRVILDPSLRMPAQVALGNERVGELSHRPHGAAAAVAFAKRMLGKEEKPIGSDRSPEIDEWGKPYGSPQQPGEQGWQWCGIFAGACLRAGGVIVPKGIVYTPTGLSWAIHGLHGFEKGLIPPKDARPGDIVYFDWRPGHGDPADHVGIVERNLGGGTLLTIEGNTHPEQPPRKGSDYGVFRRHRRVCIVGCARPQYVEAARSQGSEPAVGNVASE